MSSQKLEQTLNERFKGDWTDMAGTDGTHEYVVLAGSSLGRVGIRTTQSCNCDNIVCHKRAYRIRVEPNPLDDAAIEAMQPCFSGWKKPGDDHQDRFSRDIEGPKLGQALAIAIKGLKATDGEIYINPSAPSKLRTMVISLV